MLIDDPGIVKNDLVARANIHITSNAITRTLALIVVCLLSANLLIIYLKVVRGLPKLKGFSHAFYFDAEANFPALYSTLAILCSALLLWLIGDTASQKKPDLSCHWKFLSCVFVLLAVDEFFSIHERLVTPTQEMLSRHAVKSAYLHLGWFIPYILLLLILGLFSLKFLFKIPYRLRFLFTLSATVFLTGAIGMETVGGKYLADTGSYGGDIELADVNYALMVTAEELLEMTGIVIFIHSLTTYYLNDLGRRRSFHITISGANKPEAS